MLVPVETRSDLGSSSFYSYNVFSHGLCRPAELYNSRVAGWLAVRPGLELVRMVALVVILLWGRGAYIGVILSGALEISLAVMLLRSVT